MHIKPYTFFRKFLDLLLSPLMRLLSGAPSETPQQSHLWNVTTLQKSDVERLDATIMLTLPGSQQGPHRSKIIPAHHIPILGGWKKYIVISPTEHTQGWFIGWHNNKIIEMSRIELHTPVRMLVAPEDVRFFAFSKNGTQISIAKIAEGAVGDGGEYSQLPLL